MTLSDAELRVRVNEVLSAGWIEIPSIAGYGGTGSPGKILEELLDVKGGNLDTPNTGKWEIKFHSGRALLTLFHLEANPKGHLSLLIDNFGWPDSKGRNSFRHTIHGKTTGRGFFIENRDQKIIIRNQINSEVSWAHWQHDSLMNAFVSKLRRLVTVNGEKKSQKVRYKSAVFYTEPRITEFISAIESGLVAIDFDARRRHRGNSLRNQGKKFRINGQYLDLLYHKKMQIGQSNQ